MFEGLGRSSDEKVFNTLRNAMAELGVDCEADEENRHILFTVQGDDLEIGFQAAVIEGCILLSAVLAVTVPPERQDEVLREINRLNADCVYGHFVLYPDNGMITFDHSYIFDDRPSKDHLQFIIYSMLREVDENDGDLRRFEGPDDSMSLYH